MLNWSFLLVTLELKCFFRDSNILKYKSVIIKKPQNDTMPQDTVK